MADAAARPPGRRTIRIAQLLLVVAAAALWAASRLPWVVIRSFDGLGPPKHVTLSGASWSTALLPLALLLLATAVAALAVRGWPLRVLAVLVAVASLATRLSGDQPVGDPGRGRARQPISRTSRCCRWWEASGITRVRRSRWPTAVCTLVGAVLLMRSATSARGADTKYVDARGAPVTGAARATKHHVGADDLGCA